MAGERGASSSSPSLWAVPLSPMEEDEGDGPVSAAALFAQLDVDALRHLTALLPTATLLSLAAVSHDMAQTFCPAVVRLAVSKVSLRGCALQPALLALCKRCRCSPTSTSPARAPSTRTSRSSARASRS